MSWLSDLFAQSPDWHELNLQAMRSACFFDHTLTDQQAKALQDLLDVARQAQDDPIIVNFGNRPIHISKKQIIII